MALRSHETPMDFQWSDSAGPMNKDSEWQRATDRYNLKNENGVDGTAKKRPHSVFESPIKHSNVPSLGGLVTPSQAKQLEGKKLPTTPFSEFTALSFHIPRNIDTEFYSSGPENDTSPEQNADSEATPDMGVSRLLDKSRINVAPFRNLVQEKQFNGRAFSSGKGIMTRGNHSHGIEKRMQRLRKRDCRQPRRRELQSEPDTDDETLFERDQHDGPPLRQKGRSTAASLFNFIETHPDLPHILSFYAQLLLNVFLVFFFIYIIYSFWSTIRADVDKKSQEAFLDIAADIAKCAKDYQENFCDNENRPPVLMIACDNWNRCMHRDPETVGRAKVSAHTFAEIFNSFIEPISYKAMIFSFVLVFGCVAISNFAFGFFRNHAHPPPPPLSYISSRSQKFPLETPGYWTPYRSHPAPEPNLSLSAMSSQTPARTLQY